MVVGDTLIFEADADAGLPEREQTIKAITDTEVVFFATSTQIRYDYDGSMLSSEQLNAESRMPKSEAELLRIKV